jgi:hypothetical protein
LETVKKTMPDWVRGQMSQINQSIAGKQVKKMIPIARISSPV